MDADWGAWRFAWDVLQGIALLCVVVYTWWQTRQRVTREAIDGVRAESSYAVQAANGRVQKVEQRLHEIDRALDGRPQFEHFDNLRRALDMSNRQLGEMSARLDAMTRLLDRLHEYLLTERSPGSKSA